jgi:hypothetical protein
MDRSCGAIAGRGRGRDLIADQWTMLVIAALRVGQ